jgi:ATP-binding cassette subfamily B protein
MLVSQNSDLVIKVLQEGLGGIRDVLIDGTQEVYCKIYRTADIAFRSAQANNQILSGAPRFIIEALGMSLIAILAYAFAKGEQELGLYQTIPMLGVVALGAQRLLPILQQLYQSWSSLKGIEQILVDVLNLIHQPMPDNIQELPAKPIKFQESIVLNNVGYCYSIDGPVVLNNLNLKIKKGSRIGIIGYTGSGKTTLLDILMGLLSPSKGSLEIDGLPITSKNSSEWRAHIAHVPQNIFLADTSIAENIAFGIPADQIDIEQVKLAAEKAQIAGLIESWKKQYKTMVGERGLRLSGGERQRIGIARALYKNVDVIILDEATSALDNETESFVMETINTIGKNITLIIVAHRLTTLTSCDFIYKVNRGYIEIAEISKTQSKLDSN